MNWFELSVLNKKKVKNNFFSMLLDQETSINWQYHLLFNFIAHKFTFNNYFFLVNTVYVAKIQKLTTYNLQAHCWNQCLELIVYLEWRMLNPIFLGINHFVILDSIQGFSFKPLNCTQQICILIQQFENIWILNNKQL